ncbi:deoxycytidylate deaminase [Agarivorans aestuarii]|uniref:deoxycytidylate deaminase n=1 Tax=Agarivorans aestuarii TaxID=1563703 RepID=UPI001C80AD23|nr:deoxycytidylate deaminase [Agarivorans aestuarii]
MTGLNTIYKERRKFIVIGLTGRTGSGCTTLSTLLNKSLFSEFNPPKPKLSDFKSDEERKYRITHDYLKQQWCKFHHIKMSDVVSTFLLDLTFEKFDDLYKSILQNEVGRNDQELDDRLKKCYLEYHTKRKCARKHAEKNEHNLYDEPTFDFYFKSLPEFSIKLNKLLNKIEVGSFTRLYQTVGNNIRKSGSADCDSYDSSKIYLFSQRVNKLIKILRHKSKETDENVCVVLDAIRNPYEAFFFRERYSAFYLMSVSTENETRVNRLLAQPRISIDDINKIDERENPDSLKGEDRFWSLNLQRCIEISDIHLYNPDEKGKCKSLKYQLVKYIALIMHPGIITPSQDERCMQIAFNAKLNSGCLSRQVGAVVTDSNYSIKSVGWNNVAQGQTPCNLRRVEDLLSNEDDDAFSIYEKSVDKFRDRLGSIYSFSGCSAKKFDGKPVSYCFKDIKNSIDGDKNQVHTRALHAEENAFLQISKYGGMPVNNGNLYTTASPCELCAKKAYQLNINTVIFIDPYPGVANDHILSCGTSTPNLKLFSGAIGRAYQQLFEPIIPYKDELEIGMELEVPNQKKLLVKENSEYKLEKKALEKRIKELELELSKKNL